MITPHPVPEGFTEIEVFAIGTALLVEALLGFCLNGLTVLSFRKIKELRTPSNLLVVSIALADCGICINAFIAAFSSFLRYWPYGSEGCQIHGFCGFLAALASINCSAAVAWDRYHHYCTRSRLQWSTVISMIVFAWLFAGFWALMPLLGWGEYDYEPLRTCCTLDYSKGDRNYATYLFSMATFNFLVPGFIMLTAYQSVHQKFRKSGHYKFNTGLPLKTLFICWGPYCLLCSYAAVENVMFIPAKYRMIPALVAKAAPTVNAFVYALGNENYRGGIWQFLTGQKIEKAEGASFGSLQVTEDIDKLQKATVMIKHGEKLEYSRDEMKESSDSEEVTDEESRDSLIERGVRERSLDRSMKREKRKYSLGMIFPGYMKVIEKK